MSILSLGSNGSAYGPAPPPGYGGQGSPFSWGVGNSTLPGLNGAPDFGLPPVANAPKGGNVNIQDWGNMGPAKPTSPPVAGNPASYWAKQQYNSNPDQYGMSGGGGMATFDPTQYGNLLAGVGQMTAGNAAMMNAYANMGGGLSGPMASPYGMGFSYNAVQPYTNAQMDAITAQYAASQAAGASMHNADAAAGASRYGADQTLAGTKANAAANMYGSNQAAGANMYGSQAAADASKFGSQAGLTSALAAAMANQNIASIGAGSNNYANMLNAGNVAGTNATNLQMNQGNNATQLGLGGMDLAAKLGVSANDLMASLANTDASIANTQGTNSTNLAMNDTNAKTQLGLGGMNLQGTLGAAQYGYMSQQAQADAQLKAAQAAADAQKQVAATSTQPSLIKAQALQAFLQGGGGLGGGAGGLSGSVAGLGGGGGSVGLGGQSQPSIPSFQPANAQNVLQNFNTLLAQDQQGNATEANNMVQALGHNGFNNTSSAGGGFAMNTGGTISGAEGNTLNQQALQQQADNALKAQNLAYANNADYSLRYADLANNQYNAQQNRLAMLLGLGVQSQGQILGALS